MLSSNMAAVFSDIIMGTLLVSPEQNPAPNTISNKLTAGSKLNAFWICLLIFTQLVAVAYAADWAIITLFHLPFALTLALAIITSTGVFYGAWFAVRAAINAEREFNRQN